MEAYPKKVFNADEYPELAKLSDEKNLEDLLVMTDRLKTES
jgi:hypothetical protein